MPANPPEVIHRRYEGCIDGHEELNNKKIEMAMGWNTFENRGVGRR